MIHLLLSLAGLTLPGWAAQEPDGGPVVERVLAVMGTSLEVRLEAEDRATALQASEAAVRAIEQTEARLSTWQDHSELSRFNRARIGQPVGLSEELFAELSAAVQWAEATDLHFDPVIGKLVALWGLREGGVDRVPTNVARLDALQQGGRESLELGDGTATRLRGGCVIEEGGFGKGAGLDQAARALRAFEGVRGTLDLGGQLLVVGPGARSYGVADPRDRDRVVARITVVRGSLATTGNSERGIRVAGEPRGHVLHPALGRPVEDFGSVTVWAPSALAADCLATGLYVMLPDAALAWAETHPDIEVLVLEKTTANEGGLRARASAGLAGRVESLIEGLEIETSR